ncbi:Eco57I restriction-modification methylase domain-containing protein [Carnobacterium maltaromaticum]|uniref:Eco57I restriction-modification methylase domain-containing protein n=1 Tax=Carnobacterium maltaromaticum TaxID=2751 RepID=UPI00295E79EF|nr:Eco57I restriction-modification methylase domain-containing protein [Carnobacterium maltaromaticum]
MNDSFLDENIDIDENVILRNSPELLKILLRDRTTGKNIIWATKTYELLGKEFEAREPIKLKLITGKNASLIRPRIEKLKYEKKERTKGKAEVFTPIWIVKKQNEIVDKEFQNLELKEYITKIWLEIACGEAPYMVSRYDSVTGEFIPIKKRVGFIDKKLNKINENISDELEWINYAKIAYQTSFGYEFQGDSLLLARENLLYTFLDYYVAKFKRKPDIELQKEVAKIISYNVFQMDGLNYTTPYSGEQKWKDELEQLDLFGDLKIEKEDVPVTQEVNILTKIKYWKNKRMVEFQSFTKEEKLMKFDVVIGNPPYQEETIGENKTFARPIYHIFMEESYKLGNIVEMIHPARFLFEAGSTPKEWNTKMLNDPHLKVLYFTENSSVVFPNTDIKGGIVITYYDNDSINEPIKTFTKYKELNSILKKIQGFKEFTSLSELIHAKDSYRFTQQLHNDYPTLKDNMSTSHEYDVASNIYDRIPHVFFNEKPNDGHDYVRILGRHNGQRTGKWIKKDYIRAHQNLEKYKLILPGSNGSGEFGERIADPFVSSPNEGHTATFISIGNFDSKKEAENVKKYVSTKFSRTLLGILKATQANSRPKWRWVPLEDFTPKSDINWTKSIFEIDKQLYEKYNLTEEEINFIETKVKEME